MAGGRNGSHEQASAEQSLSVIAATADAPTSHILEGTPADLLAEIEALRKENAEIEPLRKEIAELRRRVV